MPRTIVIAKPLTPDRFLDLEALFSEKGCSFARGCWCMEYRETGRRMLPDGMSLAQVRKEGMRRLAGALRPV